MKQRISFIGLIILAISIVVFIFLPKSDSNQEKRSAEMEQSDKGENQTKSRISAEIEVFDFNDAVDISDFIAYLVINNKLKELNEPAPKTMFNATVKKVYKGNEEIKEIQILQEGNSEWVFNDNPLFSQNDEYILFLKRAVGKDFEGTDTYWILGQETNMYSVLDDNKIKKHALYDDELADIEDKKMTQMAMENEGKEVQVLDKIAFEEKINKLLNGSLK